MSFRAPRLSEAAAFAVLACLFHASASACQICLPFPRESAADRLLEAKVVVLAREDPDKPFSLKAVETLLEGDAPGLDLFLDSTTRRILAAYPERKLVCIYREVPSEDEPASIGWERIATADAFVEPVVRGILANRSRWEKEPQARIAFFKPFLGHENRQLSELAHLEIARAPYPEIKALGEQFDPKRIRAFLDNMRLLEWHSLYILLLAQSPAEVDHERIRSSVRSATAFSIALQLSAWSTAWIEIDGAEAVEFLESNFLKDPRRTPEQINEVLAALSLHGTNGRTELRDRIVKSYRACLEHHAAAAPRIVEDLIRWKRKDMAEELLQQGQLNRGTAAAMKLRSFLQGESLSVAGDREVEDSPSSGSFPFLVALMAGLIVVAMVLGLRMQGKAM